MTNQGFTGLNGTAQVLIAILPLAAIVLVAFLGFCYMLWDFRKQLAIIEKGGTPPRPRLDEKLLLIGIVSLFVGLGLTVFFILRSGITNSLLGGLMPLMAGLGLVIYYLVVRRGRD